MIRRLYVLLPRVQKRIARETHLKLQGHSCATCRHISNEGRECWSMRRTNFRLPKAGVCVHFEGKRR